MSWSFFYGFLNPFSHFLSGTLFANMWISEQGANYGMGHILSGVTMQFATALFASNYSNKISILDASFFMSLSLLRALRSFE